MNSQTAKAAGPAGIPVIRVVAGGLSAALVLAGLAAGPGQAAPASGPVAVAPILKACSGSGLPEYRKGACLDDAAKALAARLAEAVARKLAAIEAVGARAPSPGSLAGREDADSWKKAFLAAQAAWETYARLHCDSLYDFDYHGGSAAGQLASACKIRLLAARIDELRG
jgi:uncharacterized protein YecT (DUF1311 family)